MRDPRAVKIAGIALNLAMNGDFEEAARYIERLNRSNALLDAILLWIDTFIGRVYPEHKAGEPIALRFLAIETDALETADQVSWAKAWAGRLDSYRAADDHAGFMDVLRSLPEGRALGDGIMSLLNIVATSLNNIEHTRKRAAVPVDGTS